MSAEVFSALRFYIILGMERKYEFGIDMQITFLYNQFKVLFVKEYTFSKSVQELSMSHQISLKDAERKVFQSTFADGLWDVFLGCFALQFAIAPLLSVSMGDFWSSAIFLPFFGGVYLVIWVVRKKIVAPRIGEVEFGAARKTRLKKFTVTMLVINLIAFILGLVAAFRFSSIPAMGPTIIFSLILLIGFSTAAYFLDFPRLYLYGLLGALAPLIGEWLYQNLGASHHGFPIVFGVIAGIMILTGLVIFARFLLNNPLPAGDM